MNLPRSLSYAVAAVVVVTGFPSCRQKAASVATSPPAEEASEATPAVKPKLSNKELDKGYELIGKATGCRDSAERARSDAAAAEARYTKLKDSAVTAGDVMRAQEAKDEWKKYEAKAEKEKQEAIEARAEAHRLLGDEYPADEVQ